MNRFYLLILVIISFSCAEKSVQLPETNNKDILEVVDVSPIYMFLNEENDSIEFNRRNMIGTTNWLVNIDKRLTLKKILPHLKFLQEKRKDDGIHKNDAAKNYFSCSNPELKNLAFIEFTDIVYHDEPIIEFMQDFFAKSTTEINPMFINFLNKDSLVIGSQFALKGIPKSKFTKTVDSIFKSNDIGDMLFLTFKEDLTFQDYINYKSQILELNSENVTVANDEFIYK